MADTAAKVREGNQGAIGPIVGAVMKATGGSADAKRARDLGAKRGFVIPASLPRRSSSQSADAFCRAQGDG